MPARAIGVLVLLIFVLVPWGRLERDPFAPSAPGAPYTAAPATGPTLLRSGASSVSLAPIDDPDGFSGRELLFALGAVPLAGLALVLAPRARTPRLALVAAHLGLGAAATAVGRETFAQLVFDGRSSSPPRYRIALEVLALLPLALAGVAIPLLWTSKRRLTRVALGALLGTVLLAALLPHPGGDHPSVLLSLSDFRTDADWGTLVGPASSHAPRGARVLVLLLLLAAFLERRRLDDDPEVVRDRLAQGPALPPGRALVSFLRRSKVAIRVALLVLGLGVALFFYRQHRERLAADACEELCRGMVAGAAERAAETPLPGLSDAAPLQSWNAAREYVSLVGELRWNLEAMKEIRLAAAAGPEPVPQGEETVTLEQIEKSAFGSERRRLEHLFGLQVRHRLVEEQKAAIDRLLRIHACDRCDWRVAGEPSWGLLSRLQELGELLLVAGHQHAARSDVTEAARYYVHALRLAADVECGRADRLCLSGFLVQRPALAALTGLVTKADRAELRPSLPELESFLEKLERTLPARDRFADEWVFARVLDGFEHPFAAGDLRLRPQLAALHESVRTAIATRSAATRKAALDRIAAIEKSSQVASFGVETWREELDGQLASVRLLRLAVHIERLAEGGPYPAALPDAAPEDPFAPGSPLSVDLTPTTYRVWSTGAGKPIALGRQ